MPYTYLAPIYGEFDARDNYCVAVLICTHSDIYTVKQHFLMYIMKAPNFTHRAQ